MVVTQARRGRKGGETLHNRLHEKHGGAFLRAADRSRGLAGDRCAAAQHLAAFAKMPDLAWFLQSLGGIDCRHEPALAPTKDMLDDYKKNSGSWEDYEPRFRALIAERRIETVLDPAALDGACLLCSEATPHHCHRRVVAEYLREKWGSVEIGHL